VAELRDEFLSEEDLDFRNMTDGEREAWWEEWFRLAQCTNEQDRDTYTHGVFVSMREPRDG
jgi:hypothetical protein